ncbi:sporulation protein YqfD [Lottiidibacillus patelloidae]|uniref:Sporulation protein YqfD n=1 Tax=Lottiidibacillus patelloidae TaxID=2670334 RepID=A0A263BVG5_9BACI|nr:sporulation protein YqfD [Lottiidibacillus patelloidae]OZM57741.1 sporulation protein YqfD [Lottiidibacillus patelloidae]
MKNFWTHKMNGYLQLKVEGYGIERFINYCSRNNIILWHVKRMGKQTMICFIAKEDALKIRPIVRQAECKVRFQKKLGAPFFIKRLFKRSGLFAGLLACIVLMFIFSNIIWNINVQGASPELNHQIRVSLNELGIKKGKFQFLMPSPERIQQLLMEKVDGVTWIGVKLNGTTYQFQVVEKTIPKEQEEYGPRHIVATKKAVIYDYFVEEGKMLLKINEVVEKGQRLITGILGEEENTKVVSAKGKIYGLVWYKSEVTLPLHSTFTLLTGNEELKHGIAVKGLYIPIWGFGKSEFENYDTFQEEKPFRFLKWQLPISYVQHSVKETETGKREYTEEEAVNVALTMAKEELMQKLPHDSKIKSEKILRLINENGKVKVLFHFTVIEEIGKAQPIIQGE